ncbi:DUF1798 domain-containing protein [Bacillus sp. T33-2]|nr:DUF1798 domain-containing protein [Bacillus sp. T33-2]
MLKNLTRDLIEDTKTASTRFEQVKQTREKGDFYTEVKPFADAVKQKNVQWKQAAAVWIREQQPKNLHYRQIETTAENIEMVSIQAFFPETSLKRFINHVQSINYVLKSVLQHLENSED